MLLLRSNLCLCSAVHDCVSVHCRTCQPRRLLCGWINVVTQTGMLQFYVSWLQVICHIIVLLLCHQVPSLSCCWLAALTPSLAHALTHSPTHSLTHPLTHPLTSLTHSLTHSRTCSLIHPPTQTTEVVHDVQGQFLEIEAAMVALAACWVHPLPSLNRHRPQQRISDGYGLALLASMACCLQLAQLLMMALLHTRPWFQGGVGTSSWVSIRTSWCITYFAKHCHA